MAIYGIGSHFGGIGNVANKFIADGVAGSNWDVADAPDIHQIIISLKVGDIIPIPIDQSVTATVDGVPVMACRYGIQHGQYALRVERFTAEDEAALK